MNIQPLSTFATGARVIKPSARHVDFAYGRAGMVCRDDERIGVLWDGGRMIVEYPPETGFAFEGNPLANGADTPKTAK